MASAVLVRYRPQSSSLSTVYVYNGSDCQRSRRGDQVSSSSTQRKAEGYPGILESRIRYPSDICWACTMYHDATDASGSQEDLAALRSNVPLMFAFTIPVISLMIMMASASHQLLSTA